MSLADNSSAMSTVFVLSTLLKTTTTTERPSNDSSPFLKKIGDDFKALQPLQVFLLLFTCVMVICWCVYTLLYSSRVLGFLVTILLSKFYKGAYLKIGSFSVSVLGGKLMFRDIQYITEDASIRIRYAWVIFRWWGPYKAKDDHVTMNASNEPIRLEFYAEGIELHVYNRSSEYARLEKLFGLDPLMLPRDPPGGSEGGGRHKQLQQQEDEPSIGGASSSSKSAKQKGKKKAKKKKKKKSGFNWRSLVPVIKVDIVDGEALFGNPLLPTTLMIKFAEAKGTYLTRKASNPIDLFTHVVSGSVELLRVLLVPSTGYTGVQDVPPRNMGEGFVVAQTHRAEVYYYKDEPGTVPYTPEVLHMANGEVETGQTFPEWCMELKCSKTTPKKTALCMTNISYGPWADRQRCICARSHRSSILWQPPSANV